MSELIKEIPTIVTKQEASYSLNTDVAQKKSNFSLNTENAFYMQRIDPEHIAFLCIDMQEKLLPAMAEHEAIFAQTIKFLKVCALFKLPIIYTEQYPKGLGTTKAEILNEIAACEAAGCPIFTFDKTRMSVLTGNLSLFLRQHHIKQLIVSGIESHVCVYQSCRDLLAEGYNVFVPEDMTSSRNLKHKATALHLLDRLGATINNMEIIMFDLLQDAKAPNFKACQALIK